MVPRWRSDQVGRVDGWMESDDVGGWLNGKFIPFIIDTIRIREADGWSVR